MIARHNLLAVLALLALAVPPAGALDPKVAADIQKHTKDFATKKEAARKKVLATFDAAIGAVRKGKGAATARADRVKELEEAKSNFETTGRFPGGFDFAAIELEYFMSLSKAYAPIAKLADAQLDKALKAGRKEDEDEIRKLKDGLDAQLGGNKLQKGTVWAGSFLIGGKPQRYRVEIHDRKGNTIKGHVHDSPQFVGHPEYDFVGAVDGLNFEIHSSRIIAGHLKLIKLEGIVSGNRFIARVSQITKTGKKEGGLLVLDMR